MQFRSTLFWDVDPKTIDTKKYARYIIERILGFGDDREARWHCKPDPGGRLILGDFNCFFPLDVVY